MGDFPCLIKAEHLQAWRGWAAFHPMGQSLPSRSWRHSHRLIEKQGSSSLGWPRQVDVHSSEVIITYYNNLYLTHVQVYQYINLISSHNPWSKMVQKHVQAMNVAVLGLMYAELLNLSHTLVEGRSGCLKINPFDVEIATATWDTLWLFNIAMENDPFIDDVPIKHCPFSIAMLNNQRVKWVHSMIPIDSTAKHWSLISRLCDGWSQRPNQREGEQLVEGFQCFLTKSFDVNLGREGLIEALIILISRNLYIVPRYGRHGRSGKIFCFLWKKHRKMGSEWILKWMTATCLLNLIDPILDQKNLDDMQSTCIAAIFGQVSSERHHSIGIHDWSELHACLANLQALGNPLLR